MPSSSARRMPLPRSAASIRARRWRLPGVLAVLTAADMEQAGIGSVTLATPGPERRRACRAGPSGAGRRLRPPCRRGRRACRRRERGDRARRAPSLSRSITSRATRSPMSRRRCCSDAPQLWPEAPGNIALDWHGFGGADARRGRRRFRRGRACRAGPARQPAHRHGADGAARRAGALRRRERPLHPVLRLAERLCAAAEPGAVHGRCRRSASASSAAMSAAPSACARPAIRNTRRCSSRRSGPAARCAGWRAAPRGF